MQMPGQPAPMGTSNPLFGGDPLGDAAAMEQMGNVHSDFPMSIGQPSMPSFGQPAAGRPRRRKKRSKALVIVIAAILVGIALEVVIVFVTSNMIDNSPSGALKRFFNNLKAQQFGSVWDGLASNYQSTMTSFFNSGSPIIRELKMAGKSGRDQFIEFMKHGVSRNPERFASIDYAMDIVSEEINGDIATVVVKHPPSGQTRTLRMVKENDGWKLATMTGATRNWALRSRTSTTSPF